VKRAFLKHFPDCGTNKPLVGLITFPSKFKKFVGEENEEYIESIEDLIGITSDDACEIEEIIAEAAQKNAEDPLNILKFTEIFNQFQVGFVVYADLESFIVPGDNPVVDDHIPSGFCCYTASIFPEYDNCTSVVYSGENVIQESFNHLYREEKRIESILKLNVPMIPLTSEQTTRKANTTQCECCGQTFTSKNLLCCHHEHVTSRFLAFVCTTGDLKLKPRKVEVY